jgi:glycosyltransferase involved in cell wall biosynthesis
MRILFAVPGYKPAYKLGGPIESVSALAEELSNAGHSVTVFTTNGNLDEDLDVPTNCPTMIDGVEVWYFARKRMKTIPGIPYLTKTSGFLYAPAMREELRRVLPNIDVVHTHLPFIYPTYVASAEAVRARKPLVYHQRGVFDPARLEFRSWKKKLYINLIEKRILKSANTLVALTEAEVESYRDLGVKTPAVVIPNAVYADRYQAPADEALCASLGITPGDTVVLFMSRLHPIKGVEKLVEAFRRISGEFPSVKLVIAGPDEWSMLESLSRIASEEVKRNQVLFPGMVTGDVKTSLLARADLFALPSDAEGFSMAILEALASATAVLISPGCHFPEVEEAGAGRIVDANVDALVVALKQMLSSPEGLVAMGRAGQDLVHRKYTWERVSARMASLYQGIVDGERTR